MVSGVMEVISMESRCAEALWAELASIARDEGLELYDVEHLGGGGLRIFVQSQPGRNVEGQSQGGVSLDDCSRLCRRLMVFFEAEGQRFGVAPEPELEVSSPGVNRDLKYREHFSRAVGERVKVTLADAAEPEAKKAGVVRGVLASTEDQGITVIDENSQLTVSLPYSAIRRARVDFHFS